MNIRNFSLILLISCCLTLATCNFTPKQELNIGVIASLTGDAAHSSGRATVEGSQLAAKEINDQGGLKIGSRQYFIKLFTEDDQDKPDQAVTAATKLINQHNVVAIIGVPFSRNAIPAAEIAEKARIPLISVASTNPKTTAGKKYVFRIPFLDSFQGEVMASFVFNDLKLTKAAVLFDIASDYNKDLAEFFRKDYEKKGGKIVAWQTFTTDQNQDFKSQLQRVMKSQAEVLFLPNYADEVLLQVQQARELGYKGLIVGGDAWGSIDSQKIKILEGSFTSDLWAPDNQTPKSQAFVKAYMQAYNHIPASDAPLTYDAFGLLFQAMQKEGKTDPESIRQGLATIGRYTGVTGVLEYKGTGDPIRSAVILQVKGDKFVFYKQFDP